MGFAGNFRGLFVGKRGGRDRDRMEMFLIESQSMEKGEEEEEEVSSRREVGWVCMLSKWGKVENGQGIRMKNIREAV